MTTPSDLNIYQLIDTQNGRVTPRIYTDPDIYQLELERIFGRCSALFTTADLYGPDADNTSTGADPQNARISMREQLSGAKTLPEAPPAPLPRTRRGPDIDTGNRRKRS